MSVIIKKNKHSNIWARYYGLKIETKNSFEAFVSYENSFLTYNLLQSKLFRSVNNMPIDRYTRTPIKVHPLSITAPQITEHVTTARLKRGTLHQIHRYVRLPQLHVAARRVADDFHTIQSHGNVGALGVP